MYQNAKLFIKSITKTKNNSWIYINIFSSQGNLTEKLEWHEHNKQKSLISTNINLLKQSLLEDILYDVYTNWKKYVTEISLT